MADLIDRQAAIKLLLGECVAKYPCSFYVGLSAAADELSKFPAVDAVEVVKCKDCIKYHTPACALRYGVLNGAHYLIERGEGFSCSWGERREENAAD